jgi:hypothetical protein
VFNQFTPDQDQVISVPFFDDVSASNGWEGQATGKSIDQLQAEISANMSRLNCMVTGILAGKFGDRHGFQIHFAIRLPHGGMAPSRLDISCLPIDPKRKTRQRNRYPMRPKDDPRIEGTRKMALYMINKALKGMFFFSVLAPGYVPFMSMMLDKKGNTLGSVWIEQGKLAALMPPKEDKFEDGEIIDAEVKK